MWDSWVNQLSKLQKSSMYVLHTVLTAWQEVLGHFVELLNFFGTVLIVAVSLSLLAGPHTLLNHLHNLLVHFTEGQRWQQQPLFLMDEHHYSWSHRNLLGVWLHMCCLSVYYLIIINPRYPTKPKLVCMWLRELVMCCERPCSYSGGIYPFLQGASVKSNEFCFSRIKRVINIYSSLAQTVMSALKCFCRLSGDHCLCHCCCSCSSGH